MCNANGRLKVSPFNFMSIWFLLLNSSVMSSQNTRATFKRSRNVQLQHLTLCTQSRSLVTIRWHTVLSLQTKHPSPDFMVVFTFFCPMCKHFPWFFAWYLFCMDWHGRKQLGYKAWGKSSRTYASVQLAQIFMKFQFGNCCSGNMLNVYVKDVIPISLMLVNAAFFFPHSCVCPVPCVPIFGRAMHIACCSFDRSKNHTGEWPRLQFQLNLLDWHEQHKHFFYELKL